MVNAMIEDLTEMHSEMMRDIAVFYRFKKPTYRQRRKTLIKKKIGTHLFREYK